MECTNIVDPAITVSNSLLKTLQILNWRFEISNFSETSLKRVS